MCRFFFFGSFFATCFLSLPFPPDSPRSKLRVTESTRYRSMGFLLLWWWVGLCSKPTSWLFHLYLENRNPAFLKLSKELNPGHKPQDTYGWRNRVWCTCIVVDRKLESIVLKIGSDRSVQSGTSHLISSVSIIN